jgi:hypothetical protein
VNQQAEIAGHPYIGFMNPALYALSGTGAYATAFNDINDLSTNASAGGGSFTAVPGYDLATGLGTPKCGLVFDLAGGTTPPPLPDAGAGVDTITVGVSVGAFGPEVCAQGGGWDELGSSFVVQLIGVPGQTGPITFGPFPKGAGSVFDMPTQTNAGNTLPFSCTPTQEQDLVDVLVTEYDDNENILATASTTIGAFYWCGNYVWGPLNGGCQ